MTETVVLGGGCFWCTEAVFKLFKGVEKITSGYAGGTSPNPNYFKVSEGITGHAEVIKIEFDPSLISFEQILDVFWHVHDPTTLNRQGADVGTQYRSIILYTTPAQKELAEKSIQNLTATQEFYNPIVTEVKPLDTFFSAEAYHQNYYQQNQNERYCDLVIAPKIKKVLAKYKELLK